MRALRRVMLAAVVAAGLVGSAAAGTAGAGVGGGAGFDQGAVGAWVQRFGAGRLGGPSCTWTPPGDATSRPEGTVEVDASGVQWLLYLRVCDGEQASVWVPVVPPAVLGELAVEQVRRQLGRPRPAFSPAGRSVTQLPTWFWVEPATWQPVTARASVPGAVAVATAVPVALRFDPGDGAYGDGPVTCPGPGPAWTPGSAEDASPCRATYRHTPAVAGLATWPAAVSVDWRITSSVLGAPGPGATATTTAPVAVAVEELHALLVA